MAAVFLTAEWRSLLMLNYAVDPVVLRPFLPRGTELDTWNGSTLVSMVGFLFLRTRVLGLWIPGHANFEEVNQRFYVRRRVDGEWRRGVVFIKEIVPRLVIATVARLFYNENYVALPMRHGLPAADGGVLEYGWWAEARWQTLRARIEGEPRPIVPGSEEEFITEHYWGYSKQRDGGTVEYAVEHPPWRVWAAHEPRFEADAARLYGAPLGEALGGQPVSAFVAEGSAVTVRCGVRLPPSVDVF